MIRKYKSTDKPALIEILKSNTPKYFAPSEEADYIQYLEDELEDYFVFEKKGKVLGGGGINYGFENNRAARISWDLVDEHAHGQGIGRRLVHHRLKYIGGLVEINKVIVRTSQFVFPFYEKLGFRLVEKVLDFWGVGYDLYSMEMNIRDEVLGE